MVGRPGEAARAFAQKRPFLALLGECAVPARGVDGSDLSFEERENGGQVLCASRDADMSAFSAGEVEQAQRVAGFVGGFRTATALTETPHSEDAWRDTASGELIPYAKAATLRRM